MYLSQGNLFQAKATLESVIENHDGKELKKLAIDKKQAIEALEAQQNQTQEESEIIIDLTKDMEIDFDDLMEEEILRKMKNKVIIILLIFSSFNLWAQDQDLDVQEVVDVVEQFIPTIPPARKILDIPQIFDTVKECRRKYVTVIYLNNIKQLIKLIR